MTASDFSVPSVGQRSQIVQHSFCRIDHAESGITAFAHGMQSVLTERYGVHRSTIRRDLKAIKERLWYADHCRRTQRRRAPHSLGPALGGQGHPRYSAQPVLSRRGLLPRQVYSNDKEPFIDPTLFERAQDLLEERGEGYVERFGNRHPEYYWPV